MSVVNSAVQRALRTAAWSSPRNSRMNSAPTSGRKVMSGEDRPGRHQCTPTNMYQVTRAATPISMAKA